MMVLLLILQKKCFLLQARTAPLWLHALWQGFGSHVHQLSFLSICVPLRPVAGGWMSPILCGSAAGAVREQV